MRIYTELYGERVNSNNPGYPFGEFINRSGGAGTGTPLDQAWANDINGFMQAALSQAGVEPDGSAEQAGKSQVLDALNVIISQAIDGISIGASSSEVLARSSVESTAEIFTNVFKIHNLETKYTNLSNTLDTTVSEVSTLTLQVEQNISDIQDIATPSADSVTYDNADSGLEATNAQQAIDEVYEGFKSSISPTQLNPLDYGIVDGADITISLRNLITDAITLGKSWELHIPAGNYTISDEIDFSGCQHPFQFTGVREGTIFTPTAFGGSKAMFKLPSSLPCTFKGFEASGSSGDRNHPIILYIPDSGRVTLRDITVGSLGNTAIWCSRPFNADWQNLDLFFNGTQPLHKEVNAGEITLSLTAGSNQAYATSSIFGSSDIGKQILVVESPSQNTATSFVIVGVTNSTQATLDRQSPFTGSGRRFSYCPVTGSVALNSTTVNADSSMFESGDVGRFVYIPKAGNNGEMLTSRITSYISPTSVTITDAASVAVSDTPIYLTPTVYLGKYEESGTTGVNDISIYNMLVEGFRGPGIILDGGTHCYLKQLKTHGRAWQEFSNFGYTASALILSQMTRSHIDGWELEFCAPVPEGGVIRVLGASPGLSIDNLTVNAPCYGEYLLEFDPSDLERACLSLGTVLSRSRMSLYKGLVKTFNADQERRVTGYSKVWGYGPDEEDSNQLPHVAGSVRAIQPKLLANNEAYSFRASTPAGFVSVASNDSGNFQGIAWFRTTAGGQCTTLGGGSVFTASSGPLSGTSGAVGDLTVSADGNGNIYIENRTGATRRFYVSILG